MEKRERERTLSKSTFTKQFMQYYKKTFSFNVFNKTDACTYMRVSSAAGKSERIKTYQGSFYAPNLKEHSGSPKRGHRNQILVSLSQYQPNTIRALDYKQPHSHITGQNRLQTPGAPTRSALGPTLVSSPS
ncbi:hypothetical protein M9H77_17521 [Catharanthus roseus]|uniref:Uncharacterized protein n=1 Tax=Catharanthus roseus TaxID=4058 RepID=A0ACC0B4U2_CATRO|nr:hypothetical protein M9H77_17521 [Catharanthus roseus]